MSIIDDDYEIDKILEATNLDDHELIHLPIEQPGHSSHERTGVEMAPTMDRESTSELAPHEGSSTELRSGVNPC